MSANLAPFGWICSRCAVVRCIPVAQVLGIRARFANDKCPLCVNPGAGMEYVRIPKAANAAQGAT